MGSVLSGTRSCPDSDESRTSFPNRSLYETADQVRLALRASGFEACELVIGVSFAQKNKRSGETSFGGKRLLFALRMSEE